jgi:superfamily II DNA helicase RecQ
MMLPKVSNEEKSTNNAGTYEGKRNRRDKARHAEPRARTIDSILLKRNTLETPVERTAASPDRSSPAFDVIQSEDFDKVLYDRLRELRKEIAGRDGVPAYVVFSDASLKDICRRQPKTLVQFSAVNGVGSIKLEKYGEAFIKVICEYLEIRRD